MGRPQTNIPWLNRRDNGVWYVNWYDEKARQTRRQSLRTAELNPATAAYAEFLLDWNGDRQRRGFRSVKALLDFYIAEHVDRSTSDTQRPRHAAKPLVKHFGSRPLREIDIPACWDYTSTRRRAGMSDSTIRRELLVLQSAARYALKHKRISAAEMPTIEAPVETPARRLFLSSSELQAAYDAADAPMKDFIAIAYFTGARRNAIERLTVGQVDLEHGLIDLMPLDATPVQLRSKKNRPTIPIVLEIRPRLERLVEGRRSTEFALPQLDYYYRFKQHFKSLGLASKSFPHVLRHSRATHLLQAGVSIFDVAKLLGDTVRTIEKSYGHHSSDYLANSLKGRGPKLD